MSSPCLGTIARSGPSHGLVSGRLLADVVVRTGDRGRFRAARSAHQGISTAGYGDTTVVSLPNRSFWPTAYFGIYWIANLGLRLEWSGAGVLKPASDRAEQVQLAFSRDYEEDWQDK